MEHLSFAFQLILVGMSTVFVILLILIYANKALISLLNRIAPEEQSSARNLTPQTSISPTTMQLLEKAVAEITGGKGTIRKVEKIK